MTDRNGRTRQFQYDALDRLTAEIWVGASRTITAVYDAASQLATTSDPDSAYTFTHDRAGRLTSVSNTGTPAGPDVALAYTYDGVHNVRSVAETVNGQARGTTAYTYDALNRITRVTQSGSGVVAKRIDLAYNAASQLTEIRRYADLAGTQLIASSAYGYDGAGRRTGLTHTPIGAGALDYTWTLDAADRIIQETSPDGTSSYTYDPASQLTAITHSYQANEGYTYDASGNRTGGGYQVSPDNRLLADSTHTYEYDAEGNLSRRTETATGAATEYEWDYRNRLTRVLFKNNQGTVIKEVTYTYDVFDRRTVRAVDPDGSGPMPAEVQRFAYDDLHIALTFDGSNTLTHRYLYGPDLDMILADEPSSGQVLWSLADQLGTVRDLLDTTGTVQNHLQYDSFGQIIGQSNPDVARAFAFTGREWDTEAGLYYYRARYYDPVIGRFISEDPLGFSAGDTNLFRYVANNPVNHTDPLGLWSFKNFWRDVRDTVELGFWTAAAFAQEKADRFAAGFADTVTIGGTTWLREKIYGEAATRNHQGMTFTAGRIVGIVPSVVLPFKYAKLGKGVVEAGRLVKVGGVLVSTQVVAETTLGTVQALRRAIQQDPCDPFTWWDVVALLPLISWGAGRSVHVIQNILRSGKQGPQILADIGERLIQRQQTIQAWERGNREALDVYATTRPGSRFQSWVRMDRTGDTVKITRQLGDGQTGNFIGRPVVTEVPYSKNRSFFDQLELSQSGSKYIGGAHHN